MHLVFDMSVVVVVVVICILIHIRCQLVKGLIIVNKIPQKSMKK